MIANCRAISWLMPHVSGLGGLVRSTGLITAAEAINRITRIATVIALARWLSIPEFGLAAAALTTHELTRMFIQNGLGTRIVVASAGDVEATAHAVYRLNWLLGVSLAVIQVALAWPVARWFGEPRLALAIALLATVHVVYPWSMAHVYLAQRATDWRTIGLGIAGAAAIDNLMTAALALAGAGLWAIVVPKIITAVLWVIWHRRRTTWHATAAPTAFFYRPLVAYGLRVLAVEVLSSLRNHADKGLVALAFGPAAFAVYAFASNIGRGITLSISTSLGHLILPHVTRGRDVGRLATAYGQGLLVAVLTTAPVTILLAAAAPWLVPLLFGAKWASAAEIVSFLALASTGQPVILTASQLLRSLDRTGSDLAIGALMTIATFGGLVAGVPFGLPAAAALCAVAQLSVAGGVLAFSLSAARQHDAPTATAEGRA